MKRNCTSACSALVETLVTQGNSILDEKQLKELKKIAKSSTESTQEIYTKVVQLLSKNHSQIRFSCVQLIHTLFLRSHHFRTLLLTDFQLFLSLTLGVYRGSIPLPRDWGEKLVAETKVCLREWNERFGEEYTQVFHFLILLG